MMNSISGDPTSEAGPADTYSADESPQKRRPTICVSPAAALAIGVVALVAPVAVFSGRVNIRRHRRLVECRARKRPSD